VLSENSSVLGRRINSSWNGEDNTVAKLNVSHLEISLLISIKSLRIISLGRGFHLEPACSRVIAKHRFFISSDIARDEQQLHDLS
jgi:hypothetical protein